MLRNIFTRGKKNHNIPEEKAKQDIPAGLMMKCENCQSIYYRKELKKNIYDCPNCDYHHQLFARNRIEQLFEEEKLQEWDANVTTNNHLEFAGYLEKIEKNQQKTGLNEAVVTGKGNIEGCETAFAVMDASFRMGSMGSVVGEKIARAVEKAK